MFEQLLERQYDHLHNHYLWIQGQLSDLTERLGRLHAAVEGLGQLEIITSRKELNSMAKQSEEIGKLSGKFDDLSTVVTDIHSDFEALRTVMESERDNLSPEGAAALDAANAKADSLRQQLEDLNVAVGDADGSDIPTGGEGGTTGGGDTGTGSGGDTGTGGDTGGGTTPAEPGAGDTTTPGAGDTGTGDNPPAGEGTVVAPDEAGAGQGSDAQPTA